MPQTRERRLESWKREQERRKSLGLCSGCGKNPRVTGMIRCTDCRKKARKFNSLPKYKKRARETFLRIKQAAFDAYGKRCACCGEDNPIFLEIDHIENNGSKHLVSGRRAKGYDLYLWLKREGYPKGFQTLCSNCNQGKHRNGGICPHQEYDYYKLIGACG